MPTECYAGKHVRNMNHARHEDNTFNCQFGVENAIEAIEERGLTHF